MKAIYKSGFPAKGMILATLLLSQGLFAQVDTYFADAAGTLTYLGDYWYQQFTLSQTTTLVLRKTSDYYADAAIITGAELGNFTNNRSFTGYAVFDNSFGTKSVTLTAGTYYLGVRNQISESNTYRIELDIDINLKSSGYKFIDSYIQGNDYVDANGGKLWHSFTVQTGYRYFLDGCNTGLSTYVIDAGALTAFKNGGSFQYYTDYSGTDNALPGLDEISLPPGNYYLAFVNNTGISKPVTYVMERWQQVAITGSSLDLSGTASWSTSGSLVDIRMAKASNLSNSGKSGSLRLRLWAVNSIYAGGTLNGYVMGTRSLKPLAANHYYTNISGKVSYKRPPSGKYYTTLTLEEYTNTGWVIRDYINFTGRKKL